MPTNYVAPKSTGILVARLIVAGDVVRARNEAAYVTRWTPVEAKAIYGAVWRLRRFGVSDEKCWNMAAFFLKQKVDDASGVPGEWSWYAEACV